MVVDDLGGLLEVWDLAGDQLADLPEGRHASVASRVSGEQRIFYAALLQRAAQLSEVRYGRG